MQEFLLNLQISKAWKLAGILRTVKKNIRLLKQNTYICSDSISEETDMFTIRKATTDDCALIRKLAQQVFPVTYRDILTSEQIDYMMEWMYSEKNIRKQMEEEGHVYLLAYEECEAAGSGEDIRPALFSGGTLREFPVPGSHQVYQKPAPGTLPDGIERKPPQQGTAILRTHGHEKNARGRFPHR